MPSDDAPAEYVSVTFTDPATARAGFDRLAHLVDEGAITLLDVEFVHSIDGIASTVLPGRIDRHLVRFDGQATGLLDRDERDAVAAGLPHRSTAALLLYTGDGMADAIAAWTSDGCVTARSLPPSS